MPDALSRCDPAALKLIADYWVLRIVDELNRAEHGLRFTALQRALDGASPATLSNRLRCLEAQGIVLRDEGSASRHSVTYTLSERGIEIVPIIRAIHSFARSLDQPPPEGVPTGA